MRSNVQVSASNGESAPAHQAVARLGQRLARPLQGCIEARFVDGLYDVIERMDIECLQRILIVRRDENNVGLGIRRTLGHDLEAVFPRHFDVEKYQVGRHFLDRLDGFSPVGALSHHFYIGPASQQRANAAARQILIIDDNGANAHAG